MWILEHIEFKILCILNNCITATSQAQTSGRHTFTHLTGLLCFSTQNTSIYISVTNQFNQYDTVYCYIIRYKTYLQSTVVPGRRRAVLLLQRQRYICWSDRNVRCCEDARQWHTLTHTLTQTHTQAKRQMACVEGWFQFDCHQWVSQLS